MKEYCSGSLEKNISRGTLLESKEFIPLKNQLGEIVNTELFLCDQPEGYFPVEMIKKITVHKECEDLAKFIDCSELCGIHYEDLDEPEALTADDVEMLMDDYFANSEEILRCFYWNGKLSEELLHTCSLEFLAMGQANFDDAEYAFPEEPVGNLDRLQVHVSKLWENPTKVVSVHVERVVKKGQRDGKTFDLDIKEVRRAIMDVYAPEDAPNLCFCQMCRRVKPQMLMEVNNLEYEPEYFFPQLRISLCLECSKRFELLRYNDKIRADYMRSIKTVDIPIGHGTVDIPIGKEHKVTFTAKHLAEIQEILRRMPDDAAQRGGQQNVRSWNESSGLYPA